MIKSPRWEREGAASSLTGHVPSESEGREQAGASGGRGGGRDDGGAGVEGFDGLLIVLMPPPGVGGGSEQAGRSRPERKRRGVYGRARAGEGVGGWDARRGDIQRL